LCYDIFNVLGLLQSKVALLVESTIFSIILRQLEKWENYKKISYQKALVVL
jgi:hypothetical protein